MIDNSIYKEIKNIYTHHPPLVKEAFKLQKELVKRVVKKNYVKQLKTVAGVDLALLPKQKKMICGIIVFSYPDMIEIERVWTINDEIFPYIPGLLAFREGPAIIKTFNLLNTRPDVLIVDGHGIAHPRRFGIACHAGVLLDTPSFGIGKKMLYGVYDQLDSDKGAFSFLKSKKDDEIIGAVLRTRDNVKPVFVSVGNKIDLKTAMDIAFNCNSGYRIPIPTREADKYVAEIKKEINQ